MPTDLDNFYSVKQLAFIFKVHPLTIRRYITGGKLKAIRIGGNVRIKESELAIFNQTVTPNPLPAITKQKTTSSKIFIGDDPFFQLMGRGASLK